MPLSVIIPVYNEVESLSQLYTSIIEALNERTFEIIFVNDGSIDGSDAFLNELADSDQRIKVIHFVRNYGQTAALSAGIKLASHETLITMDADGQNDPSDIPMLLEKLKDADVVCGWRKNRKDTFLTRTLPSKIANWLISKLSKVHLHDYGCTLRAYKRPYIQDIPLYGEMHRFIPIYVTWAGAKVVETPVKHHPRRKGVSKYGLWRIPKVLLDLTTLKFLRDFFVTPIYFFGLVGVSFSLIGLIVGCVDVALWLDGRHIELAAALAVLAPIMIILGVVEITLGIIAEVLIRMHHEHQNKAPYRIGETKNLKAD